MTQADLPSVRPSEIGSRVKEHRSLPAVGMVKREVFSTEETPSREQRAIITLEPQTFISQRIIRWNRGKKHFDHETRVERATTVWIRPHVTSARQHLVAPQALRQRSQEC